MNPGNLLSLLLLLTIAVPAVAQMDTPPVRILPPTPMPIPIPDGQLAIDPVLAVQRALNLSDAQVAALRSLLVQRSQDTATIFEEARQSYQTLHNLVSQPNPNPTDVGIAYLATQNIYARVRRVEERFRTEFNALLTPEQRQLIQSLKTASEQIESLRWLGIFDSYNWGYPGPVPMPVPMPPAPELR